MPCSHCGAPLDPYASACGTCGALLLADSAAWQSAQHNYHALLASYQAGQVDLAAYQDAHATLAVQDANGRYWLPGQDPNLPFLWTEAGWTPQPVNVAAAPRAAAAPPMPPPQPEASVASWEPAAASGQGALLPATPLPKKRRRGGCCLVMLIALLLVAVAVVWVSPLPQRWGLRRSPAEKTFAAEPDRQEAASLTGELEDAGLSTKGLYLYVLPYTDGQQGSLLYALLDSADGFRFPKAGDPDAVINYMIMLASTDMVQRQDVREIAIDYRDSEGQLIAVLTAPTDTILAYSRGEVTREEFMQALGGQVPAAEMMGGIGL